MLHTLLHASIGVSVRRGGLAREVLAQTLLGPMLLLLSHSGPSSSFRFSRPC
jgi:hypothetical protein